MRRATSWPRLRVHRTVAFRRGKSRSDRACAARFGHGRTAARTATRPLALGAPAFMSTDHGVRKAPVGASKPRGKVR